MRVQEIREYEIICCEEYNFGGVELDFLSLQLSALPLSYCDPLRALMEYYVIALCINIIGTLLIMCTYVHYIIHVTKYVVWTLKYLFLGCFQ